MHLCRALQCSHIVQGFRARYGSVAWSTRKLLEGPQYIFWVTWTNLADVHVGGRTDDIDFDIWPILRRAQPAKHPRILQRRRQDQTWIHNKLLTMSVLPIREVVDMRPLENEGSGVRSMRTMAGTPKLSQSGSLGLRDPSKVTAWVVGSTFAGVGSRYRDGLDSPSFSTRSNTKRSRLKSMTMIRAPITSFRLTSTIHFTSSAFRNSCVPKVACAMLA